MSTDQDWSDWIRTEANFGQIRTAIFFEDWLIRTGSD